MHDTKYKCEWAWCMLITCDFMRNMHDAWLGYKQHDTTCECRDK